MVSSTNAALIARFRRGMVAEAAAKQVKPAPPLWDGTPLKDPSGLLVYQPEPAARLAWTLRHNNAALDGSDTGCHAADTEILMFSGEIKKVQDVAAGDQLMGMDSTPRTVLRTIRGRGTMVRITPVKGDPFVVNEDHILSLVQTTTHSSGAYHKFDEAVFDVSVWDRDITWNDTQRSLRKLFRVPADFPERPAPPIDPYFLGVLLGDGCLLSHAFSVTTADQPVVEAVQAQATAWGAKITAVPRPGCQTLYLRASRPLKDALRTLALLNTVSDTKFVPQQYLTGSRDVRKAILAGLLDTDGHLEHGGFDYISKSKRLARGVAFLARSLGLAAYVKPCRKGCQTGVVGDYFRVSVSGDCDMLPMRVKIPPARRQRKSVLRTGFQTEYLGLGDYFGFELDGDRRYLMGDFTVTHNTGKSYQGAAAFRELGLRPVIVCPKTVIPAWDRVCRHIGIQPSDIVSWELVRTPGRTPWYTAAKRWTAPVLFDECHRGKNQDTQNSRMMLEARRSEVPTLCSSATAACSPLDLRALGYLLGLHEEHNFLPWARSYGCRKGFTGYEFKGDPLHLRRLHHLIFPSRGVRVRIADLGNLFPETRITAEAYRADNCSEIQRAYDEMEGELRTLLETMQDDYSGVLVEMLRSRQKIELLKVPLLFDLACDVVEDRRSAAVFVNYEQTRVSLLEKLAGANVPTCSIHGGQTAAERQHHIDLFQTDQAHVCVANAGAGGVGVSLHDVRGERAREALICPDFSAVKLKQVLGRVHRAGGKTPSIQKIVLVSGTIEDGVSASLAKKLANLDFLNDGDLMPGCVTEILKPCYDRGSQERDGERNTEEKPLIGFYPIENP